jgi:hypothetical protein
MYAIERTHLSLKRKVMGMAGAAVAAGTLTLGLVSPASAEEWVYIGFYPGLGECANAGNYYLLPPSSYARWDCRPGSTDHGSGYELWMTQGG